MQRSGAGAKQAMLLVDENIRIIDPRNAYMMDTMLVTHTVRNGCENQCCTQAAGSGGKTGTTNEYVDAWFAVINKPSWDAPGWADQPRN